MERMPSESETERPTGRPEEKLYKRWIVFVMACFNVIVNASICYNVGIMNIAWLMAIYYSSPFLLSPLASIVINTFSCRICVFSSGIFTFSGFLLSMIDTPEVLFVAFFLTGIGFNLSHTGGQVIAMFYFQDMTTLVNGIFVCAGGLGAFIYPPLTQWLIDVFGFQKALFIIGCISLTSSFAAFFLKPNELELELKKSAHDSKWQTLKQWINVFKNPGFVIYLISIFFFQMAEVNLFIYLPGYFVDKLGYTEIEAAATCTFDGLGRLPARILASIAASDENIRPDLIYLGMSAVSTIIAGLGKIIALVHYGPYILYFLIGFYVSGMSALMIPLAINFLSKEDTSMASGLVYFSHGIAAAIGPIMSSEIRKIVGNDYIFTISLVGFLVSSLLFVLALTLRKKSNTTERQET